MLFGMARPQGFDVWGDGGRAGYEDRHKQRISSSNPFCITAGCALDEENEQNNKHFSILQSQEHFSSFLFCHKGSGAIFAALDLCDPVQAA